MIPAFPARFGRGQLYFPIANVVPNTPGAMLGSLEPENGGT
jgi:hypothetical protein